MNAVRIIVYSSLRGYRTNRGSTSVRRSRPPREMENNEPEIPGRDLLAEEYEDPEDLDAYESDFTNVSKYDKMHQREMEVQKAKLMTQIVKRKYFKTEEPAMLTWDEKEQIRLLYSQDPVEWTPDTLSESFPASREAVLKILRSKWSVKSAKVVEKYQETVKNNWALFKAGKLKVEPQLEAHFEKFKNRKIRTIDPETIAEKILKPKPVFPNPRSTIFSDIVRSCVDDNSASDEKPRKRLTDEKSTKSKSFESIFSKEESCAREENKKLSVTTELATEQKISRKNSLTFDQFLQTHVQTVRENDMTPVDRVLVDELKSQSTETYKNKSLVFKSDSAVTGWKENDETNVSTNETESATLVTEREKKELAVPDIRAENSINPHLASVLEGSLETGIIARQKTEIALQDVYPDYIKIPPKKFKPGVTYRVQDRYYDDDGEFLYRVPGIKT